MLDIHISNDMNINDHIDINISIDINTPPPHALPPRPLGRTAPAWGGVGGVVSVFILISMWILIFISLLIWKSRIILIITPYWCPFFKKKSKSQKIYKKSQFTNVFKKGSFLQKSKIAAQTRRRIFRKSQSLVFGG